VFGQEALDVGKLSTALSTTLKNWKILLLRITGVFLKSLKRRFKHKDTWYELIIKPARLVDKDGNEKEYYPTHQEEIVEEALKKSHVTV
jgi:hypothetical protein